MVNLLWDLDGTLIDSMPLISESLNKTAQFYQKSAWSPSSLLPIIGPELGEMLAIMLELTDPNEIAQAKEVYRGYYRESMLNSPWFEGIQTSLSQFNSMGCAQFVATAKLRDYAEKIIQASDVQSCFLGVYGSLQSGQFGDKKKLLEHLLEEEQLQPAQTIMIGDTRFDIEAGRHLNLTTIAVCWGYGERSTLEDAGAHFFAEHPSDLITIVKAAVDCGC